MDDGLWVLMEHPPGVGAGTQFKYVLMSGSKPPRWEGRANRNWREAEAPVATHLFDSTQNERPKKPAHLKKKLSFVPERLDQFIERVADENQERVSYRLKLELPRILLEEDLLNSLSELACLQAYLTFVASGQISCKEDGGHHRPCAAANAAKAVTEALWDISTQGDAELFIARRIFPSLPSFSDEFTCAVPMTRIRDIAHRGDIPHDMKQYIKHNLQNKLHRCADPGDLIKLDQLVERVDREGGYSQAFVRELKIFQVELRDFFNATGLDDSARQIAAQDGSVKDQALTALRRKVAPKVVAEQNWLRLDIELEKYAFVLLSQVANQLEHDSRGSQPWWDRLLKSFSSALQQTELSGLSVEECRCVQSEIAATETSQLNQRGSMAPLRLVASMDRTLRTLRGLPASDGAKTSLVAKEAWPGQAYSNLICFKLTAALEAAYAGVPALGRALHIDAHAVAVFVEAELRASVLFQVSKLAQLAMQQAKVAAGLPLWTAISAGTACGRCMMLPSLAAAWQQQLPEEGCVLFCNEASGDEEVPKLVRGVVVARDLPVLSHLALRARQLGVVFACTAEGQLYEKLKAQVKERQPLQLTVDAAGDCRAAVASEAQLKAAASGAGGTAGSGSAKPKLGELNLSNKKVLEAVALADQPQVAGSKAASSGKLEKLSAQLGFKAPKGMAIPFGVMKSSVSGGDFQSALKRLETALSKGTEVEVAAAQVREAVEKMTVPKEVLSDLAKGFPAAARVAVRSSANSEDLEKVSGAGLHDSVLGVDLKERQRIVWGSMFTLRAVQSRHAAGMPLYDGIAMGVLVQPMVSLSGHCYAFIAFSKDPLGLCADSLGELFNDDAVYIEMCIGLGETLASANEPGTPYRLTVQKREPMEVKIASLGSFSRGLEEPEREVYPGKMEGRCSVVSLR
eukprot:g6308.t1